MEPSNGLYWPPRTLYRTLLLVFLSLTTGTIATQAQSCASNAALPAPVIKLVTVDMCQEVWSQYNLTLRFKEDLSANTLSIVFIVPQRKTWYGIGFNKVPNMVGSSAIVSWVDPTSAQGFAKPYFLGSQDPSGVKPDSTRLVFRTEPALLNIGGTYYVTFEIDLAKSTSVSFSNQVYAVGEDGDYPVGTNGVFNQHKDYLALQNFNYLNGASSAVSNYDSLARAHGILNIIGWGILLPAGAIVARYARGYDPAWFFAHGGLQILGFVFVIAGVVTGLQVGSKVTVNYDSHQALGIVLLVISIVQISAILIRPKKEAKIRRYWNWGHWWVGRVGLLLGAINIFVGIDVASASKKWTAGYGIIIGLEVLLIIVLETLYWINYLRSSEEPHLPQTSMQRRDPAYDSSPPRAPPPPYEWDQK